MNAKASCLALAALVLAGVSIPALATLAGDAASVQADVSALTAKVEASAQGGSTIYAMTSVSGTAVREYLSAAGSVYAVSWEGPVLPDLRQILGAYFSRIVEASNAQGRAKPLIIRQPDFVFESSGSMRAFSGKAYVPRLLPAGVSGDALR